MANNLNIRRIIQEAWPEAMLGTNPNYPRIMQALEGEPGTVKFGDYQVGGIATTIADNATEDPAAQPFGSFQASFESAEKVVTHSFPSHLAQSEVGLLAELAQFAAKVAANIDLDAFSGLEGQLTAASPRAGAGVGQNGAGKLVIDTGKKGLQTEGGEFTYANKIASDLSESALDSAVQLMMKWRDDRGLPMNLGRNGLILCVNTADVKLASQLTESLVTSADQQSNFYKGMFRDIVQWEFTDADAWFLVDALQRPFGYRISKKPVVEVRESAKGTITHIVGTYNGCFVYSPYEYGVVGSVGNG